MTHTLCLHGHFYQPPRENPWLGQVLPQPSAWPFHDWNARITAECYSPCALSPPHPTSPPSDWINTYEFLSFNIGPTLIDWLQTFAPRTYAKILAADAASLLRLGHGNAIAQVYNHIILPLASPRDQRTQTLWGFHHFAHHFCRPPQGMWLAETAVDLPSLEALVDAGLTFTILSPTQAARARLSPSLAWTPITAPTDLDTSLAYWQTLPSGRRIALVFYGGPLSNGISFGGLLRDGDLLAAHIRQSFADKKNPALLLGASDGEVYGHHWKHGDESLAKALKILQSEGVQIGNIAAWLAANPPTAEVEIVEHTAWSCSHGLGRWTDDCGCRMNAQWKQHWRKPLRAALDTARDLMASQFERDGGALFHDPWAARDRYIEVLLDPSRTQDWLSRELRSGLSDRDREKALWMLESQRFAMLMYTSCGWFFDEVSGLETVQCMQYAARAFELAEQAAANGPLGLETQFLSALEHVPSNLHPNARIPYEKLVRADLLLRARMPPISAQAIADTERALHALYDAQAAPLLKHMAARDEQTSPMLRALGEAVVNDRLKTALAQTPPNVAAAVAALDEAQTTHLMIHEQPARYALGSAISAALAALDNVRAAPVWLLDLLALTKRPPCDLDMRPLQRAVVQTVQEDPLLRVDPALWAALGLCGVSP
jgi:alpha-amylase/alpha-mannosidase (GH57 family)